MKSKLIFLAFFLIINILNSTYESKLRSEQIKFATTSSTETKDKSTDQKSQTQTNTNNTTTENDPSPSGESPKGEQEPKIHQGNCFMKLNNYFYDLYPLSKSDIIIKGKDGSYNNFNLCKNVETVCHDKKGLFVNKETCSVYSDEYTNEKIWEVQSKIFILHSLPFHKRRKIASNSSSWGSVQKGREQHCGT